MTAQRDPVTSSEQADADAANPASGVPDATTDTGDVAKLRRECARHRTALREAEKVIAHQGERLARIDRATVESHVADRLENPTDFWLVADDLDALRGDDGEIDPEIVNAKADEVLAQRPHWAKVPAPAPDFDAGARPPVPQPPRLGQAIKDVVRGR